MTPPTLTRLACPIPIDRSAPHRRSGWSGDPGSRTVECEWVLYFVPGASRKFPNGPSVNRGQAASDALLEHIRSDWHVAEDFIALGRAEE